MRISKDDIEKSILLHTRYRAANQIDNSKEIAKIKKQILEKNDEFVEHRLVHEDQKAFTAKNQIDVLNSQILNLNLARARAIEDSERELKRFHSPFQKEFAREIQLVYRKAEMSKKFFSNISVVGQSNIGLPVRKAKTNLLAILKIQKRLSQESAWFQNSLLPLSEQIAHFEKLNLDEIERNLSLAEEETLSIFGDAEVFRFSTAFSFSQRDNVDWVPEILSESVLTQQIQAVEDLKKPKTITVS